MKLLACILFHAYLLVTLFIVFFPIGLVMKLKGFVESKLKPRKSSYFSTCKPVSTSRIIKFNKTQFPSFASFLSIIVLFPSLKLASYFKKQPRPQPSKVLLGTPNQISSIVTSQLIGNVKTLSKAADCHGSKYLFALQPSLLQTGPITEDDKIFYKAKEKTFINGFPFPKIAKRYYAMVIEVFNNDADLSSKFMDLTRLFADKKSQRLVDTVHMGNVAQDECAKVLSERIFQECSGEKCD